MSSQESSSFYQNSSGESEHGEGQYDVAFGGSLRGAAQGTYSGYESTSTTGYGEAGVAETLLAGSGGARSEYRSSSVYGGFGAGTPASSSGLETGLEQQNISGPYLTTNGGYSSNNLKQQSISSATYATDTQGFFKDPNPEIVRRPAPGGPQTYTQRILVRFLQPPAVPPPGPLIIKEVRPPQPPPPPPLYIRQRPPPPPTLPPIVIREAPPKLPPAVGTQVITKMLPALPVPPRSVIIERLPPLPSKPRDIVVERWLPYRAQEKRRVIIQRAPPPVVQQPRNIIIYYEAPSTKIVRRFENLGVQSANPAEYVARYGTQLEDSQALITQARQAGVVEDITPPAGSASNFQSSSYESYQSGGANASSVGYDVVSSSTSGYGVSGGLTALGDAGLNLNSGAGGVLSSGFESSSSYNASSGTGGYAGGLGSSFSGLGLVENANNVTDGSSSYEYYSSQQTINQ
ncbi:unnamed protein product [Rotaria socialis]|uniref:Uncharacterized protein n=1 Tax=Rotaria socialis TaxID=392032 RepID=A0A818VH65_9BILA|nr:unnamed protein product [Rotaria socialis]CAF3521952.1 unnamed protein product [Rotaria socialis]CAF3711236.1 unnamed protein product [Rotaria socialis]CAF4321296.1 unnamed protein product [Rotaria socialis]CAF4489065.1 unnamed protein product [Rotaria socialis]